MRTLHIALAERADGGDSDFERAKIACEDGVCEDTHVSTCVKLRPHVVFSSGSDARATENNLMRHNYRKLSDEEKQQMTEIKDRGLALVALLHNIGGTLTDFNSDDDRYQRRGRFTQQRSRELSIAQTHAEEAVMWAVKHVTG